MSTTARLAVDIIAADKSQAAFASAQRSMAGLNRSVNQLKGLFAGLAGGNLLVSFVRSLVETNKASEPVKTALDNLSRAWQGFALKVGDSGLNTALVNFADTIGRMIIGTDGLSSSIGAFMAGAVNVMTVVFEGIGRAIAFTYDNASILANFLAGFALVAFTKHVISVAYSFISWAKAIRATGIVMGGFSMIQKSSMAGFVVLAGVIGYATGSLDEMRVAMDTIWQSVKQVFPEISKVGGEAMEALGFDMSALSEDLKSTADYMRALPPVLAPATAGTAQLGKAAENAKIKFGELGTKLIKTQATVSQGQAVMQEFGGVVSSSFNSAFSSVVNGTEGVMGAFQNMASGILSTVTNMLANRAFTMLLNMALGQGTSPSQSGGGIAGMFGNLFGGARAGGGPVSMGKSYLVGERGPELFTPGGSGTITPSGGGANVNVTIINQAGARVETRKEGNGNLTVMIRDAVNGMIASGGSDGAMRSRYAIAPSGTRR